MGEYVLRTKDLTKKYSKNTSVDGISLEVRKGDIYGFIGKNGAGKTTTIKMIAGLSSPSSGEVELFDGENILDGRKKIGTVIESPALYPYMTAYQNIEVQRIMTGVKDKSVTRQLLDIVGLQNVGKKKVKNFSLGMKQRLAIAIALVGEPEFLLLDEPINGLDPSGIKDFRELIVKLNKEAGITVLISSHILSELAKFVTCYGVINDGKLIKQFKADELNALTAPKAEFVVNDPQRACAIIEDVFRVPTVQIDGNSVIVTGFVQKWDAMQKFLEDNDIVISAINKSGDSAEEYFLELMEGEKKQ